MGVALAYVSFSSPKSNDPYVQADLGISVLKDQQYQRYFAEHIDIFFKEEGINGMINRVIDALAREQITMFVCHSLAHDIGHYGGYPDNFPSVAEFLSKKNLDFCGSGFMHGVEGQLANEPYPQNVKDLYTFCRLVLPLEPYYEGCYHGAGHSFMENTRDPDEALAQCDMLKTDDVVSDVYSCYQGVFSEHANYLRASGKGDAQLLTYCGSLTLNLQQYCAAELNGLDLPPDASLSEVEEKLHSCVDGAYSDIIKQGCIRSVAGVAVDRLLGQGEEITVLPFVLTLPIDLQHEYISSTIWAFGKTAAHNDRFTLSGFCASFEQRESRDHCRALLEQTHSL
jgi:hypothetical protein